MAPFNSGAMQKIGKTRLINGRLSLTAASREQSDYAHQNEHYRTGFWNCLSCCGSFASVADLSADTTAA